jgi:peptide/nickel transport system substrate-binding protein
MDRRTFLKSAVGASALAAASGLARPAISQRAAARALRLVPSADLSRDLERMEQL